MAKDAAKDAATKPAKKKEKKDSFGKRFAHFFKDLKSEVKKVVWPSKKQIKNNAFVVLSFMAIAAVFVWIIDFILSALVNLIFK